MPVALDELVYNVDQSVEFLGDLKHGLRLLAHNIVMRAHSLCVLALCFRLLAHNIVMCVHNLCMRAHDFRLLALQLRLLALYICLLALHIRLFALDVDNLNNGLFDVLESFFRGHPAAIITTLTRWALLLPFHAILSLETDASDRPCLILSD